MTDWNKAFNHSKHTPWVKWFAWHPVIVGCKKGCRLLWLKNVERCTHMYVYDLDSGQGTEIIYEHEYRSIEK